MTANMPCPFCGAPRTTVTHGENSLGTYRQVTCDDCGAFGPRTLGSGSDDEARRRWDRRTVTVSAQGAAKPTTYEETLSLAKALFAAFSEGFTSDTMTWDQQGRRQRAWLRVADRARRLLVSEDAAPPGHTVGVAHACRPGEDVSLCGVRTKAPDWMTSQRVITEAGLGEGDDFPCPACWTYGRKGSWIQKCRPDTDAIDATDGPLSDRLHQLVASMESLAKQVRALQQTTPTIAAFDAQRATYEMSDKINADVMQEFKNRLDEYEGDLKFVRSNHGSCISALERDANESRAMVAALRGDYMKLASRLDALDHPAAGILKSVEALADQVAQVRRITADRVDDAAGLETKVVRHQEWLEAIQRDLPKFARADVVDQLAASHDKHGERLGRFLWVALTYMERFGEDGGDLHHVYHQLRAVENDADPRNVVHPRDVPEKERPPNRTIVHAGVDKNHPRLTACGRDPAPADNVSNPEMRAMGGFSDELPCPACWELDPSVPHARWVRRKNRIKTIHACHPSDARLACCGIWPDIDELTPSFELGNTPDDQLACPKCWRYDMSRLPYRWVRAEAPKRNGELDETMLARVLWKAQYDLYPGSTFPEFEDAGSEKQRPFYAYARAVNRLYRGDR